MGAARRIAVIGNVAGGKSTLSRALSEASGIPHREYDGLLWRGVRLLPDSEAIALEQAWLAESAWIIDGMGAWAAMERRLDRAEAIIFIDLPLWQHYAWAAERRIDQARRGAPLDGKDQALSLEVLLRIIEVTHHRTRPKILAYLQAHPEKQIMHLRNKAALLQMVEDCRKQGAARRGGAGPLDRLPSDRRPRG
jgi:adenylate kinase family enzyme